VSHPQRVAPYLNRTEIGRIIMQDNPIKVERVCFEFAKLSPSSSSSWAELALLLISLTTNPALKPPHILRNHHHISCATTTQASSEIAGNDQNFLTNICWSTLVKLKTIEFFLKNGRRPSWKIGTMTQAEFYQRICLQFASVVRRAS
jgi:hypothetical protein